LYLAKEADGSSLYTYLRKAVMVGPIAAAGHDHISSFASLNRIKSNPIGLDHPED